MHLIRSIFWSDSLWYAAMAVMLLCVGADTLAIAEIASTNQKCAINPMVALCALTERESLSAGVVATAAAVFAATLAWGAVERQIHAARDDFERQILIERVRRQEEQHDRLIENLETICSALEIASIHAEAQTGPIPGYVIERCAQRLSDAGIIDRRLRQALHGFISDAVRYNQSRTVGQMKTFYVRARCLRGAFRTVIKAVDEGSIPRMPFLTARQVKGVAGWDSVAIGWVERLLDKTEVVELGGNSGGA